MLRVLGKLFLSIIFIFCSLEGNGQWNAPFPKADFLKIHTESKAKSQIDPFLVNGVFYENPYYSAKGHPFLGMDSFYKGSVVFRGKYYDELDLKFEIFDHQIILGTEFNNTIQSTIISMEFLTEFSFDNMHFKKLKVEEKEQYYQVIAEGESVSAYRFWYKNRNETHDEGNYRIFSFSEEKYKTYLCVNGEFFKYKNNRSFIKLFPENMKATLKGYLKDHKISVDRSNVVEMGKILEFMDNAMHGEQL